MSSETIHPVIEVAFTRGSRVESLHRAHAAIVDSSGRLLHGYGEPHRVTYLRSSAKPFQAAAMIASGTADKCGFSAQEIAICCGSHGGEPVHQETVAAILNRIGLTSGALQCGIQTPLDAETAKHLLRSNKPPTVLHHNCSGKHSGMLAITRHLRQPVQSYLDPHSETQQRITAFIAEACGLSIDAIDIAIDGCSAPVHAIPLSALALGFARIVDGQGLSDEIAAALLRAGAAMRSHPEMVAATRNRICTELIRTGSGLEMVAKAGAESVYAAGWRDPVTRSGRGLALKVEDGAQRARDPVLIELLAHNNCFPTGLPEALAPFADRTIRNWAGLVTGEVVLML